jgi:aerobic-type carbon monoxide dehydrogenase small subunit (CoxS/CutS family)
VSKIELKVNGRLHTVDVEPSTPLLYILRNDLDLRGPRFGCGLGQCGACKVIINGTAVFSCITPVASVKGEITTLEGLSSKASLDPVQQAWIDEQAPQCGFCQNGQIMTAKALLDKNPHPSDAQIREAMNGTLCRCMSYFRVQSAIKRAIQTMAEASPCCRGEGGGMSSSNSIPKQIEHALVTHRRGFLKTAGLLAVSLGVFGQRGRMGEHGSPNFLQVHRAKRRAR